MNLNMKRNYILIGLLLSTFLSAIEGTVIGPAGPRIVGDLGGVNYLSWVFTAYLLTMVVATPVFGKMSDLFGRKLVFVIGSILFITGSLLCCFAQNMTELIIFRAIQGIGAGALTPVIFTIIGDIYKIEERVKVQALISSVWGISSLIGPLVGGYVVDYLNWRWVFGFNVPFGLLSLWFIVRYLDEQQEKKVVKIDIWGAVTFIIGVTSLLFVLATGGQQFAWQSPILLAIAALGVVSMVVFFIVESKVEEPLVPMKLFRIRDIAFSNLASLFASAIMMGLTSYFPLWVQGVLGESATRSGLLLAPMSIGWLLGSVLGGRFIVSNGSRYTSLIGMLLIGVGAGGMAFITDATSQVMLVLLTLSYGVGFGLSLTVFTIIAQSSVQYDLRGSSTALNTFTKSLGQTIGVSIFGALINYRIIAQTSSRSTSEMPISADDIDKLLSPDQVQSLPVSLWNELRHVLEGGLHTLFIVMAIISIAGLLSVIGLRNSTPSAKE